MKINRVRYLKGPNYFSYKPAMWIELDLEDLEFQPSNTIEGFPETLLETIPSLYTHTCSLGYEGGFAERLKEGTWMGHILEHMALELQSLAGIEVSRGKTITSDNIGIYYVTYDYKEEKSGLYAFEASMEIVGRMLQGEKEIDIKPYVEEVSSLYYNNKLGPSTESIFNAALKRKIPVERIGRDSLLRLGTGSKQKYVQATITSQTSQLAVENSCDKQATKDILESCGVPVPKGEVVSTKKEIFEAAERLGFPLVIKPLNGRQGQGVMTNIKNTDELFNVVNCLDKHYKDYIIERYYEGNDYRLLVVDSQLIAASLRLPPFVIGNGKDSIELLIEEENKNPLRGECHEKPMTKIPLSHTVSCYLEKQDLTLKSVPKEGQIVQVVGNANLSTGGQAIDVTDQIHPTLKEVAITAAKAMGLDVAGVDMICRNISEPFHPDKVAIVEVNAAPGIRMHHYPSEGEARDVGGAIVDYLFKSREEAAIPVVAVTGTNGKTTTTRLIKHLLEEEGVTVGMTNSDGVYIGKQSIDEGDCSGPISAKKILSNPTVDMAVLETARGGILREGLAFRYCDVGIVTNVSEDHLGMDGIETFEQLVKLKRLIPEVVIDGGHCILNADDPNVAAMAEYTSGAVVYTSLDEENELIQNALDGNGKAWVHGKDGWIYFISNGQKLKFLPSSHVPVTINGTAKHNIANLLQSLAGAHALGTPLTKLKERAVTFVPDFSLSKGRFNMVQGLGRTVIVDYAHNVAGLNAIYDTISSLKENRVITVISAPGDRPDSDIETLAKISANHSDILVLKDDKDLRGRSPYEVPKMMRNVALKEKPAMEQAYIILEESDAFQKAWELSEEGDILLFIYEDFNNVTEFMKLNLEKQHSE